MVWSIAILFYLVFAVASGEPEPNVNVKINVNVNGESEESQESGVSCNLVWGSEDYRPLIMLRETKTIVPPVDSVISKDPNRIPIGIKLVIACPGQDNIFNNFVGNQTKLHGECVAENQFKVCFNNSPVYLDLSTLSCSKKLFPSFVKQDNGTSDDNGCDELGGQLYKQGYTYGDYYEFKDLEIDVCFSQKNVSTICTSPNLNGNETDYRTTRGFSIGHINEPTGRDTRMDPICGNVPVVPAPIVIHQTWRREPCVARPADGILAQCLNQHGTVPIANHKWCYTGQGDADFDWDYCKSECTATEIRNLDIFETKHICKQLPGTEQDGQPCRVKVNGISTEDALNFVKNLNLPQETTTQHLFNVAGDKFQIAWIVKDKDRTKKENVCMMWLATKSWVCIRGGVSLEWSRCDFTAKCSAGFADNGHLAHQSYGCPNIKLS